MTEAMMNDFTDVTPEDQGDPISPEMESLRSEPGHLLSHRPQQVTRKDRMLSGSGCRAVTRWIHCLAWAAAQKPEHEIATFEKIVISVYPRRVKMRRKSAHWCTDAGSANRQPPKMISDKI